MITTDNELLGRYLKKSDSDAFEELVRRHSSLVMGVCRGMLFQQQDAEDAFQATFLILSKKARSLLKHGSIAGWLYQTAVRNCLQIRRRKSKSKETEMFDEPLNQDEPWESISQAQELDLIYQEINQLPKQYREVIVLCHINGRTRAEAAELLDRTETSVKALLARGRNLLRNRLIRHGLVTGAVLAMLRSSTVRAASDCDAVINATISVCQNTAPTVQVGTSPEFVQTLANHGVFSMHALTTIKSFSIAAILMVSTLVPLAVLAQNTQTSSQSKVALGSQVVIPEETNRAVLVSTLSPQESTSPETTTNEPDETTAEFKDQIATSSTTTKPNQLLGSGAFSIENSEEYWRLKVESAELRSRAMGPTKGMSTDEEVLAMAKILEARAEIVEAKLHLKRIQYERENNLPQGALLKNTGFTPNSQLNPQPVKTTAPPATTAPVIPGEILIIESSVDKSLGRRVVVTSDHKISLPLVGDIDVAGHSTGEIQDILNIAFAKWIKDPIIFVARESTSTPINHDK